MRRTPASARLLASMLAKLGGADRPDAKVNVVSWMRVQIPALKRLAAAVQLRSLVTMFPIRHEPLLPRLVSSCPLNFSQITAPRYSVFLLLPVVIRVRPEHK